MEGKLSATPQRGAGLLTEQKKAFQNKLHSSVLIKILFEFTPFFKRQNFAKFEFISIQARKRLLIGVICFLLVDRSIAGGGGGGKG